MKQSYFSMLLLLLCVAGRLNAQVTFTNAIPEICLSQGWVNLSSICGAQPSGGYWRAGTTGKASCCDTIKASPTYGFVNPGCLGVSGTGGNPAQWQLTYVYTDSTHQTHTGIINLKINALPVVSAGADYSVCYNEPLLQLFPSPNNGSGAEWLVPPSPPTNISHPQLSNPVLVYNTAAHTHFFYPGRAPASAQDTTYMLVYRYTNPATQCSNTDTTLIYVKPVPVVNGGAHVPVCSYEGLIDLAGMSGVQPLGGTWSGAGVNNGKFDPGAPGIGYGVVNTNVITYTCTNAQGCTASDTTGIVVNTPPNTQFSLTQQLICETFPAFQFTGTPTGGTYFLNGLLTGSSFIPSDTTMVKYIPDSNRVEYRYTNPLTGCYKSAYQTIHVQRKPQVHIVNPGPYYAGKPFVVHANKKYASGWLWSTLGDGSFSPGGNTSVADSVDYTPGTNDLSNKSFSIVLVSTGSGVCPAATDTLKVGIWTLSLSEAHKLAMVFYPNPTNGKLFIRFKDEQTHEVKLLDMLGREVLYVQLGNDQTLDLQQHDISKGFYLLAVDGMVTKTRLVYW